MMAAAEMQSSFSWPCTSGNSAQGAEKEEKAEGAVRKTLDCGTKATAGLNIEVRIAIPANSQQGSKQLPLANPANDLGSKRSRQQQSCLQENAESLCHPSTG